MYGFLLQGSTLPLTECDNATVALYGPDDDCSRTLQYLVTGNEVAAIMSLIAGDCPTRFSQYLIACNDDLPMEDIDEVRMLI